MGLERALAVAASLGLASQILLARGARAETTPKYGVTVQSDGFSDTQWCEDRPSRITGKVGNYKNLIVDARSIREPGRIVTTAVTRVSAGPMERPMGYEPSDDTGGILRLPYENQEITDPNYQAIVSVHDPKTNEDRIIGIRVVGGWCGTTEQKNSSQQVLASSFQSSSTIGAALGIRFDQNTGAIEDLWMNTGTIVPAQTDEELELELTAVDDNKSIIVGTINPSRTIFEDHNTSLVADFPDGAVRSLDQQDFIQVVPGDEYIVNVRARKIANPEIKTDLFSTMSVEVHQMNPDQPEKNENSPGSNAVLVERR